MSHRITIKKIILLTILFLTSTSFAAVSKNSQNKFSDSLNQMGLSNHWVQNNSLWIQNPGGFSKMDLEGIGNSLCGYNQGFFVVTFWQNIRTPSGKITTVTCRD